MILVICGVLHLAFQHVTAQTCYTCNYVGASSSDPAIANELGILASRQTSSLACQSFTSYQAAAQPTVNCQTLSLSAPPAPFNALTFPVTQWTCGKQDFTFVMRDYANDIQVQVPLVVRGCVPVQSGSPYYKTGCVPMTDDTDPYVRAITDDLYSLENGVGPVVGSVQGTFCMCGGNKCNRGSGRLTGSWTVGAVAAVFALKFVS